MRGRRPQPPELRLLKGNLGRRPIPRRDVEPTKGAECPEFLNAPAKAEWARLRPELERLGLLTSLDRAALACLCEAWSDLLWATRVIRRQGHTITAGNGTMIPHPAVQIRNRAMKAIKDFAVEFGFTPAARARVGFVAQEPDDPDDERFFGPRPVPPKKGNPA